MGHAELGVAECLEESVIINHQNKTPHIASSAYVAPNAAICGDVTIGEHCRIMHGAQIIAEGGAIAIGDECIVMENGVLRSNTRHSLSIGNNCLIGPNAHVVGCRVEDQVFIATGAAIFHGAKVGRGSEVRVNGIVTSRPACQPAPQYRSAGWRWAIRPRSFHPISTKTFGPFRSN